MEFSPFLEKIIIQGLVGGVLCMAAFIFALHREWVYMRGHFKEVERQRDVYKALNDTTKDTADKILALLEAKTEGR